MRTAISELTRVSVHLQYVAQQLFDAYFLNQMVLLNCFIESYQRQIFGNEGTFFHINKDNASNTVAQVKPSRLIPKFFCYLLEADFNSKVFASEKNFMNVAETIILLTQLDYLSENFYVQILTITNSKSESFKNVLYKNILSHFMTCCMCNYRIPSNF